MFVSEAWAQTGSSGSGDIFVSLMPLILIFAVFYFLLIRPQQKRQKAHREAVGALRRGDKVLTGGGIFGTVVKIVDDTEVLVEISEGVRVSLSRMTIQEVISKSQKVGEDIKEEKKVKVEAKKQTVKGGRSLFNKISSKNKNDS